MSNRTFTAHIESPTGYSTFEVIAESIHRAWEIANEIATSEGNTLRGVTEVGD